MDTDVIILAGGKGRRLGREKAKVELDGASLLERAIKRLAPLSNEVVIVKAPKQILPPLNIPDQQLVIVTDVLPEKGPLIGIYSGLKASRASKSFVVACDMPFVNLDIARYLISKSAGYEITIPASDGYIEPLHAVYSKDCLEKAKSMIESGIFNISYLVNNSKVKHVNKSEMDHLDTNRLTYFNINTADDYNKAKALCNVLTKPC